MADYWQIRPSFVNQPNKIQHVKTSMAEISNYQIYRFGGIIQDLKGFLPRFSSQYFIPGLFQFLFEQ